MSTVPVTVAVATFVTLPDPNDVPFAEGREAPHVLRLVEAARGGSREAFGDLVTLYERVAFRTALAALQAREDAEDAAQEGFVLAWQNLPGFRGDSTFRTWLLTIVWRKALDKRRQRRAWQNRIPGGFARPGSRESDPVESASGASPDPERAAVARDLSQRVRTAIGALSPKLRDTLLLAANGEHSYQEIAGLLAVPVGTVKWRIAEARRIVRALVPDACPD